MDEIAFIKFCDAGKEIRKRKDKCQWELGDLACEVEICYGGTRLVDFAKEIGVSKSSIYNYRNTAKMFPFSTRLENYAQFPEDVIGWTHYMQAARLGTYSAAIDMLNEALDNFYTTDEIAYHVSKRLGGKEKSSLFYECTITGWVLQKARITDLEIDLNRTYRIKVYEE